MAQALAIFNTVQSTIGTMGIVIAMIVGFAAHLAMSCLCFLQVAQNMTGENRDLSPRETTWALTKAAFYGVLVLLALVMAVGLVFRAGSPEIIFCWVVLSAAAVAAAFYAVLLNTGLVEFTKE